MATLVTFSSSKGGCGKTSVCVNLAGALSLREKTVGQKNSKVLVIDLDTQGAASHHLAKKFTHFTGTIINGLEQNISLGRLIHAHSENIHFIPCDMSFASWSEYGKKDYTKEMRSFLSEVKKRYD